MNLEEHLKRQIESSRWMFGPDERMEAVIEHIEQKLDEIRESDIDPNKWIDVVILVFDGLWRTLAHKKGIECTNVLASKMSDMLEAKQEESEQQIWDDWLKAPYNDYQLCARRQ